MPTFSNIYKNKTQFYVNLDNVFNQTIKTYLLPSPNRLVRNLMKCYTRRPDQKLLMNKQTNNTQHLKNICTASGNSVILKEYTDELCKL